MTEGEFEEKIGEYRPGLDKDATNIMRSWKMGQELVGELLVDLCEPDKETGLPKYHKWDGYYGWLKTRLKWKAGEVWDKERIEAGSALSLTVTTHTDYEEDWQADAYKAGLGSGELPPGEEDVEIEIESYTPAGISSSWSDSEVYSDPARGVFYGKKWNELDEDARPRAECPNVRVVDCPKCLSRTPLYTAHGSDLLHRLEEGKRGQVARCPLSLECDYRQPAT